MDRAKELAEEFAKYKVETDDRLARLEKTVSDMTESKSSSDTAAKAKASS